MDANEHPGIFIVSIAPLAPLPEEATGVVIFRITMQLVIADQKMQFDVEMPAHGFDEAAQVAYARAALVFTIIGQIAQRASDALLSKIPKSS